jgi:transcriptional regulator with XRE-family HTH domain
MDLGLSREEAARMLGIKAATLTFWELGFIHVSARHLPGIIRFLGYDPAPDVTSLPHRLRAARRRLGISQKELARRFGMDPKTIRQWEAGRVGRRTRRVEALFEEFARAAEPNPEGREEAGSGVVTCGAVNNRRISS